MMKIKPGEHWPLGFLALLGLRGVPAIFRGECLEMAWLAWFAWIVFFLPERRKTVPGPAAPDSGAGREGEPEPGQAPATAKKKEDEDNTGLFIPAGLFLGMGLGFLLDNLVAGLFLGLGAGFLGMALASSRRRR